MRAFGRRLPFDRQHFALQVRIDICLDWYKDDPEPDPAVGVSLTIALSPRHYLRQLEHTLNDLQERT